MTDSSDQPSSDGGDFDNIPQAEALPAKWGRLSFIWLVPLLAIIIGVSMLVSSWVKEGPVITVSFKDAQGIVADKTEVKYKSVVIGKVKAVALSHDRSHVLVTIDLDKSAASFATQSSRFWVVKPRVGLGGVSGLGTLLSGAYIGADSGASSQRKTRFKGLETPPPLTHSEKGKSYLLSSKNLGSLTIGSPVYYRHIQVGRVVAYHLDKNGKGVSIQVFVKAPNDRFVTTDTRFWNASGVDLTLGSAGLKLDTQSLASIVSGGIAFATPPAAAQASAQTQAADHSAASKARFTLFHSREVAMQPKDGPPIKLVMRFRQSIRGLEAGAAVDFRGIRLGSVTAVTLAYDVHTQRFPAVVKANIYPSRIGVADRHFRHHNATAKPGSLMALLVKHGLRAQLRNGNLLAGKLYVALDFFPEASKVTFDANATPLQLPTIPGSFDKLQQQVADIAGRLDKVPFGKIGQRLDVSLAGINRLLNNFNNRLAPQVKSTLETAQQTLHQAGGTLSGQSSTGRKLNKTLDELQQASRSLRSLADYLQRHPEALLRGRHGHDARLPDYSEEPH